VARHVTCVREVMNAYKIFVRKLEENRLLGRPRRRWDDNIGNVLR